MVMTICRQERTACNSVLMSTTREPLGACMHVRRHGDMAESRPPSAIVCPTDAASPDHAADRQTTDVDAGGSSFTRYEKTAAESEHPYTK